MCRERDAIKAAIAAVVGGQMDAIAHEFETEEGRAGTCPLRLYREDGVLVLICSHGTDATGISVTNAAPAPWEQAEHEHAEAGDELVIWLEHVPSLGDRGQSRHQFDRVVMETAARGLQGTVKWRALGIHDGPEAPEAQRGVDESDSPYLIRGNAHLDLFFMLAEIGEDDDLDEEEAESSRTSFVKVSLDGTVNSATLSPERTAFIDLDEVQPRVRAKQAYALAVEFAARTGNAVDPGVVAIIA